MMPEESISVVDVSVQAASSMPGVSVESESSMPSQELAVLAGVAGVHVSHDEGRVVCSSCLGSQLRGGSTVAARESGTIGVVEFRIAHRQEE